MAPNLLIVLFAGTEAVPPEDQSRGVGDQVPAQQSHSGEAGKLSNRQIARHGLPASQPSPLWRRGAPRPPWQRVARPFRPLFALLAARALTKHSPAPSRLPGAQVDLLARGGELVGGLISTAKAPAPRLPERRRRQPFLPG